MGSEPPLGVVLAGGASLRMGRDKALLEIGGESLVERAARRLGTCCQGVLVADAGRGLLAGPPSTADGPGKGPAAGILGAATAAPGRSLLVLACDLPLVPEELLELLAAGPASDDWVVPGREGRLEPLCALYRPAALAALEAQVTAGVFAPHRLAENAALRIRFVSNAELATLGDPAVMFANLNRPEDLTMMEEHLS